MRLTPHQIPHLIRFVLYGRKTIERIAPIFIDLQFPLLFLRYLYICCNGCVPGIVYWDTQVSGCLFFQFVEDNKKTKWAELRFTNSVNGAVVILHVYFLTFALWYFQYQHFNAKHLTCNSSVSSHMYGVTLLHVQHPWQIYFT